MEDANMHQLIGFGDYDSDMHHPHEHVDITFQDWNDETSHPHFDSVEHALNNISITVHDLMEAVDPYCYNDAKGEEYIPVSPPEEWEIECNSFYVENQYDNDGNLVGEDCMNSHTGYQQSDWEVTSGECDAVWVIPHYLMILKFTLRTIMEMETEPSLKMWKKELSTTMVL